MEQFDDTDRTILTMLQNEGRLTNVELASRVGLTPPPTLSRVKRLEEAGLIRKYVAVVDQEKLGLPVTAFVHVIHKEHTRATSEAFLAAVDLLPEVLECHHIAGDEDFLLKVVAASPLDYEKFVLEKLTAIEGVQRVKTTFVLSSPKNETAIPVRN
ncbi:MAG: Lrp/AsnC family transcriptional regulator [Armatimonadota bacterium]|nr:Lrp/AsnC family transcriptional regulator [Armatimonadota bacterium]